MIKINKKKFLVAALVLLLTGILIGQGLVQAKPDTYEELKAFTQALELVKRNYVEESGLQGTDPGRHPGDDLEPRPALVLHDRAGSSKK